MNPVRKGHGTACTMGSSDSHLKQTGCHCGCDGPDDLLKGINDRTSVG